MEIYKRYDTVLVLGSSGSGKTAIRDAVVKHFDNTSNAVVTCTSRDPREFEKDKVDYNFYSREEFESLIDRNRLIEHAHFNNNIYGSEIRAYDINKINFLVVEPSGVLPLVNNEKLNVFEIIKIETDDETIKKRVGDIRFQEIVNRRNNNDIHAEYEKLPENIKESIRHLDNNENKKRTFAKLITILEENTPEYFFKNCSTENKDTEESNNMNYECFDAMSNDR